MIKFKGFSPRQYQSAIAHKARASNTLVVLPTGLGKTAIALMVAIDRLERYKQSKILVLAPTKPLASQHQATFHELSTSTSTTLLTGSVSPQKRAIQFTDSQIIFSTPQGIENDLINKRINLSDVSLLVFDEAHRAVGQYSYVWIAQEYLKQAQHPLIMALTASPGSDMESIKEICTNLHITHIEQRTDKDDDVRPYVQHTPVQWIEVGLSDQYIEIITILKRVQTNRIKALQNEGFLKGRAHDRISRTELLQLQRSLQASLIKQQFAKEILQGLSLIAQVIKVMYALELVESQGIKPFITYMNELYHQAASGKVKANKVLSQDDDLRFAYRTAQEHTNLEHPKLTKLKKIIQAKVAAMPQAKIIIFNQYRDSIHDIVQNINQLTGITAKEFVGQAKKRGLGLSQKEQIARLKEFATGSFNVIVMSSVGEEGLDIPQVDLVVFYEPVPSAVRSIQRRGRTGRNAPGQVIVLVAKGTRDEAYRWSAFHKEKGVHNAIKAMGTMQSPAFQTTKQQDTHKDKQQAQLQAFEHKPIIIADTREKTRGIIHTLQEKGCDVRLETLKTADYVISSATGIEFKTTHDFAQSIIDGRLFEQAKQLAASFEAPLFIVQGSDIFSVKQMHPNAIYGALTTLMLNFRIPVFFTRDSTESAHLISMIAKREQGSQKPSSPTTLQPSTTKGHQEALIAAIPGIGHILAQQLLTHHKSISGVINATTQQLSTIPGLGTKKAQSLKDFVEQPYD